MFFKFAAQVPDPHLSWIIAKNPAGEPYQRDIGNAEAARRVTGRFLADGGYEVVVNNDPVSFFERMRKMNEAAYVRPEVWIVCPANLKGLTTVFKSAIFGDNTTKGEVSDEQFRAPKLLSATMGPFPFPTFVSEPDANCETDPTGACSSGACMHTVPPTVPDAFTPVRFVANAFGDVGLRARVTDRNETREACVLEIETIEPMSVTEFLQKIYIVSMALTMKFNWTGRIDESQIDKYLELSQGWLGRCKNRDRVISQISGYKKSLVTRFQDGLPKEETEESEGSGEDRERRISLHEKRHALILGTIPCDTKKIVDLGSSEGKLLAALLEKFESVKVVGVEANREKIWRIRRRIKNDRLSMLHANLLYPQEVDELLGTDVLIASEVIEHLERRDRERFVRVMRDLVAPPMIILTTPNIEYNPVFGLQPGELRHWDHRIEYNFAQLCEEVLEPLARDYDVELLDVVPNEPQVTSEGATITTQPSFFVVARRRSDAEGGKSDGWRIRREAARMGQPLYLGMSDVTVKPAELLQGFTAYPFLQNARNIFYLGPTMAPTDYSELAPEYLEHPVGCFAYFKTRGVRYLVEEPKYMGSRGYLLAFKNEEQAHKMGFDGPLVVNARSGGTFFKDQTQLRAIYEDIRPKLQEDFVILDAEILPWSLKATKLIAKDFRLPGEAALLWRRRCQPEGVPNAEAFLRMVDIYGARGPLEVRPFHVLARGRIRDKGPRAYFADVKLGFFRPHLDQLRELDGFAGDIIKPLDHYHVIDLDSEEERNDSILRWEKYCGKGGEGFVYKPSAFLVYDESGYIRQPAIKVRGADYLRIIYGMDYLRPEYLGRLQRRGTWAKRKLAIQEQELGIQMLRCFVHHNEIERLRTVGAFLGLDDLRGAELDKTL